MGDALADGADRVVILGTKAVTPAATTGRNAFSQMIGVRSPQLISCPTANVPNTKAIEAEPRIQPYSKRLAPI
jgi:hypothetical protein